MMFRCEVTLSKELLEYVCSWIKQWKWHRGKATWKHSSGVHQMGESTPVNDHEKRKGFNTKVQQSYEGPYRVIINTN